MENEQNTNNLNVINLKTHNLNNTVKNKDIRPATCDQSNESTHDPQSDPQSDDETNYIIPKFSDDIINDLEDDNNIIFNKNHKPETYKNKALFYIYLTHEGRTVTLYAYGYKPEGYKHIDNLGNLYFGCADWFLMSGFAPFTHSQFYKLMLLMYNFKE